MLSPLLSDDQRRAGIAWLGQLRPGTPEDGRKYLLGKRVGQVVADLEGMGFSATVKGNSAYETQLLFESGEWESRCDCPVEIGCKHAAALMYALFSEQEDADGDGLEDLDPDRLMRYFEQRLGRKVGSEEMRCATQVVLLSRRFRRVTQIPRADIAQLLELRRATLNVVDERVWPHPPKDAIEAWLYLVGYLRRNKLPIPRFWTPMIDWSAVDALVAAWERNDNIERWRVWLDRTETEVREKGGTTYELRVQLADGALILQVRKGQGGSFKEMTPKTFAELSAASNGGRWLVVHRDLPIWRAFDTGYGATPRREYTEPDTGRILNRLLRDPDLLPLIVGPKEAPIVKVASPLLWTSAVEEGSRVDYAFALRLPDGSAPPPPLIVLEGSPSLYVTTTEFYEAPPLGGLHLTSSIVRIPAEALETSSGVGLIERIGVVVPERLANRLRTLRLRPVLKCSLLENTLDDSELLVIEASAEDSDHQVHERFTPEGWIATEEATPESENLVIRRDRRLLASVEDLLAELKVSWWAHEENWQRTVNRKFPEHFAQWLETVPEGVVLELDAALSSLRDPAISAHVRLEVEESGIDWFDVRIALDVQDTTLTAAELKALLEARGGFVRLGKKGWRRLAFELSEEDQEQLADLGLNAAELNGSPQRLHALQIAGRQTAKRLLSDDHTRAVERRAAEIRTRVSPSVPETVKAQLRPYQLEGFHFLAYLSANRFGGILADDMGLGKTLQTLTWLVWLRNEEPMVRTPCLVVCPKSVTENWRSEAAHFAPHLKVVCISRGAKADDLNVAREGADVVVLNYAQLRLLQDAAVALPWHIAILDEAQAIKNPESQTARAAWKINAAYRLALSGTPIENRLLDLWSIMEFAMPGVLGPRASFARTFDQRTDPFARKRLSSRVRPFVIRRTKAEVARDLPERIEEDLVCELESTQGTLYRAELKRARAALLKLTTQTQFQKARFNMLTSLLRLRQICCHPRLVSKKPGEMDSCKLSALLELLEPLVAEGHKVLVFSQFVEMLGIIQNELVARDWKHYLLTGDTDDRGALVRSFQEDEGAGVFLISLRAGGFGLNLTAASYVVLFDPWWNPAVENQAIDRTHRIGQKNTVIAYRLLVKETIEQKIRMLQTQKRALAADILGEENFTGALSLDDFRFLLGVEDSAVSD